MRTYGAPALVLVVAFAAGVGGACSSPSEGAAGAAGAGSAAWAPPAESEIPADSFGAAIRRGLSLIRFTPESLPRYATSNLRCTSCHQLDGRKPTAAPLVGAYARYPQYLVRTGAVVTIHDRVNYCFTRSVAGQALPSESREMADIVAYLAFLSRGAPPEVRAPGAGALLAMPDTVPGDTARGRALFDTKRCAQCHGSDGAGLLPGVPALWGPRSFAIAASLAREERAASFIYRNMPQDAPGTLSVQEAFDLAAYVTAHERPDSPGKERDFPLGGAPRDVPYATAGHAPYRPPPRLLPRANPAGATVPPPPSVRRADH
jgi:thiosulfate dehydrogenase